MIQLFHCLNFITFYKFFFPNSAFSASFSPAAVVGLPRCCRPKPIKKVRWMRRQRSFPKKIKIACVPTPVFHKSWNWGIWNLIRNARPTILKSSTKSAPSKFGCFGLVLQSFLALVRIFLTCPPLQLLKLLNGWRERKHLYDRLVRWHARRGGGGAPTLGRGGGAVASYSFFFEIKIKF